MTVETSHGVAPQPAVPAEAVRELTSVFARAVRRLGQAGHVEEASRLAGKAYVALMRTAPDAAEHVNGVMHYLARLPEDGPSEKERPCR
jgi:hypothetical protein